MAKKDPIDMPVEERLKTLYQLQATLSAIDEKRALRGELPLGYSTLILVDVVLNLLDTS